MLSCRIIYLDKSMSIEFAVQSFTCEILLSRLPVLHRWCSHRRTHFAAASPAMPAVGFLPLVNAWYNDSGDAQTAAHAKNAGTFVEICDNVEAFAQELSSLDTLSHNEIVTVHIVCLDACGHPRSRAELKTSPSPSFVSFYTTLCGGDAGGAWGGSVMCVWETLVLHFVLSDAVPDMKCTTANTVVVLWADSPVHLDVVSRTIDVAAVLVTALPNGLYYTSVSCGKDYAPTLLTHPYPLGRQILREVLCRAIANLVLQSIWTQDGYVFPQVRRQKEIQRIIHASTTPSAEHTFASTLHHYLVANLAAVR
eukprot:m.1519279 g.1519279  ORF g.1519279 m.1519279 type:complete len:309 (-) comp25223_c0_seq18:1800-2726(-)